MRKYKILLCPQEEARWFCLAAMCIAVMFGYGIGRWPADWLLGIAYTGYGLLFGRLLYVQIVFLLEALDPEQQAKQEAAEQGAARALATLVQVRKLYIHFREVHGITLEDDSNKPGTLGHLIAERDALRADNESLREKITWAGRTRARWWGDIGGGAS